MIRGIGTDIIEIHRIRESLQRHSHFVNKIFTPDEQGYCLKYKDPVPYFAGRFAAKEAVSKALGMGFKRGFSWKDVEIVHNEEGKPLVMLSLKGQELFGNPEILISISHCREYATATAIMLEQGQRKF